CGVVCFFFFKQKTAYEIGQCLEFRRVLFRSATVRAVAPAPRRRGPAATRPAARCSSCRTRPRRRSGSSCGSGFAATRRQPSSARSEERRVGKEWRGGGAAAHLETKEGEGGAE